MGCLKSGLNRQNMLTNQTWSWGLLTYSSPAVLWGMVEANPLDVDHKGVTGRTGLAVLSGERQHFGLHWGHCTFLENIYEQEEILVIAPHWPSFNWPIGPDFTQTSESTCAARGHPYTFTVWCPSLTRMTRWLGPDLIFYFCFYFLSFDLPTCWLTFCCVGGGQEFHRRHNCHVLEDLVED